MAHPDNPTVDRCLSEIKNGSMDSLAVLYDITSKPLYALTYSYFKNREDAEDALSDTYLKIVREIGHFQGQNGFNWIYTICKNICLNLLKRKKRESAVDLSDEKTVNLLDAKDSAETVIEDESGIIALAKRHLKTHEFEIVMLHAVGGFLFKDIAKLHGKLEATVRWQYHNAIKKLQKLIGEVIL